MMSSSSNITATATSAEQQEAAKQLSIEILHEDPNFVVIHKPANLRSVPGFAQQQQPQQSSSTKSTNKRKRQREQGNEGKDNESNVETITRSDIATDRPQRRTAQEAWGLAIKSFSANNNNNGDSSTAKATTTTTTTTMTTQNNNNDDTGIESAHVHTDDDVVEEYLCRLASSTPESSISSIPRKYRLFEKYLRRNHRRILLCCGDDSRHSNDNTTTTTNNNNNISSDLIQRIHTKLQQRMKDYMNLPRPLTKLMESAFGQLQLHYGSKNQMNDNKSNDDNTSASSLLRVVHRLDCETSGCMVFAKNPTTASFLCEAWRNKSSRQITTATAEDTGSNEEDASNVDNAAEQQLVEKIYIAMVREWRPYQQHQQTTGIIDVPLQPSPTERLKWQVATAASTFSNNKSSKPCLTRWKVLESDYPLPKWCNRIYKSRNGDDDEMMLTTTGIVLELQPITGRTHQLRVHCAHVGSGIIGESLYGTDQIANTNLYDPNNAGAVVDIGNNDQPRLLLHAWKLSFPYPPNNNSNDAGRNNKNKIQSLFTVSSLPTWYQC